MLLGSEQFLNNYKNPEAMLVALQNRNAQWFLVLNATRGTKNFNLLVVLEKSGDHQNIEVLDLLCVL